MTLLALASERHVKRATPLIWGLGVQCWMKKPWSQTTVSWVIGRKGKERKSIYIAPFILHIVLKRSDMHNTVLPANNTMPAFFCKRSPDGATPNWSSRHPVAAFYDPQKGERLSWPGWLTYSGWFTHKSGHPSAAGRAQDRESSPAKDRRSTAVPCNHTIRLIKIPVPLNCKGSLLEQVEEEKTRQTG